MVCVFAGGKGVWSWAWCYCNARFLSRVRARVLLLWCLGVLVLGMLGSSSIMFLALF